MSRRIFTLVAIVAILLYRLTAPGGTTRGVGPRAGAAAASAARHI